MMQSSLSVPSLDPKKRLMDSMSANLPSSKLSNAFNYLFAGGLAGAVSRTSTAPLDRLKLLLQIQRAGVYQEYRGLLSGLIHIYREGGITAFFRGNGTNIVKIVPESAVKFYTYEQAKNFLSKNDDTPLSLPLRFVAGATAGLTSQLFIYPLECVKTRLAISPPGTYRGIFNCIATMYQREGLRSLFRGLRPALLGVVPYSGIDLTIYETLKNFSLKYSSAHQNHPQTKRKNEKEIGVLTLLGCGIISSSIGQLVSYPLSLARTRLQAQGLPGHPVIYLGMKDVFVKTFRAEGILGLYRGIVPNFVKVAPAVSISYAVYESTKNFLAN